jgi:hypothetical protein
LAKPYHIVCTSLAVTSHSNVLDTALYRSARYAADWLFKLVKAAGWLVVVAGGSGKPGGKHLGAGTGRR